MVQAIASVEDGASACVRGRVRAAAAPLISALGERPCVYWEVREGLDGAPRERGAQPFWLEDGSGRVLVCTDSIAADMRAERERAVITSANADVQVVSQRLREVKRALRVRQGQGGKPLIAERKRLSKLATLLCAIRAQARGNVHIGGTLHGQEKWIRANAHLAEGGPGAGTVQLVVERWELVLAEGDEVEVEGAFHIEPLPPGVGAGGGYRDRPTGMIVRGDESSPVRLRGVGASAPIPREERREDRVSTPAPTRDPRFERRVFIAVSLVASAALIAWYALR
jgi:hypothetical protein